MAKSSTKTRFRPSLVEQWVEKAENDLRNALIVIHENDPPTDTICFHCHQTAEKYLKAYLIHRHAPLKRVHDLRYLLNTCIKFDPSFSDIAEAIKTLNGYYIETRYPMDMPIHYPINEAKEAVNFACHVRDIIKSKLNTN